MYNWAEDSIIRERVFVPTDKQQDYELFPDTLPGAPGGEGRSRASLRPMTTRRGRLRARARRPPAWRRRRVRHAAVPGSCAILAAIPVLLVLSIVTFAIIQAPPGDYGDYIRSMMIEPGPRDRRDGRCAGRAPTASSTGSTTPLPVQYFNWIGGIVTRGDFGHSFFYNKPVADVVAERLPRTHRCWR